MKKIRRFSTLQLANLGKLITLTALFTVLFAAFTATIAPSPAFAQTQPDLNLTITPPVAYLTVQPGQSTTHLVKLKYSGQVPVTITANLVDFATDGLSGLPQLQPTSQVQFITLANSDLELNQPFQLKPNSEIDLLLKIAPSAETPSREYPLSLLLTATPDYVQLDNSATNPTDTNNPTNPTSTTQPAQTTQTAGGIASNIILAVQNDLDNLGQLEILSLKLPRLIDTFGQLKFELTAKNTGRNAVAATGEITLINTWTKQQLRHWHIYPDVVLANNSRRLRGLEQDPAELNPESEISFAEFAYNPPLLFGPYQVNAQLSSASGTEQLQQQTQTVFAFPFSVLGLIILGVLLYLGYLGWEKRTSQELN